MSILRPPPFSQTQLREAVRLSRCWRDVLRRLGFGVNGRNTDTVRKYAAAWGIDFSHFDPYHYLRDGTARHRRRPLEDVLVEDSTFSRGHLKRRLFDEGLKQRSCEECGQGELWRGRRMSLILDHVNGVPNDHRLENLRILCPNCAATLDTHCGRKAAPSEPRACPICDESFMPRYPQHRYCSIECVGVANARAYAGVPRPARRKVERPPYEQLVRELAESSFVAVGRRYGVSDNAVRKWVRYEEERRRAA